MRSINRAIFIFMSCFLIVLFIMACDYGEISEKKKETAYKFIRDYIKNKSQTKEYKEIQTTFGCFYRNATLANRRYFQNLDTASGEKFYGLDSLIIFNQSMDSAITFFIEKVKNYESSEFHFNSRTLFAYKSMNNWKFYDGCATTGYTNEKYTYLMTRNNERLWFVFDGEWLKDWDSDKIKENPGFVHHACEMWCGPCADERDSLNMDIYYRDIKKNTPPDSLYICR